MNSSHYITLLNHWTRRITWSHSDIEGVSR